jgi:hypothetical protein
MRRRPKGRRGQNFGAAALVLAVTACADPVYDAAVAALGPEDPNVPVGPLHRPGQPCLLCHKQGGGAVAFGFGGTVYLTIDAEQPVANVTVWVLDANDGEFKTTTNCAGNFFALATQYTPAYPYWASLRGGRIQRDMDSPSNREGSCAACHTATVGPASPGPVYLIDDLDAQSPPPDPCD